MRHLLGGARVQTVQDDDMLIVLARTARNSSDALNISSFTHNHYFLQCIHKSQEGDDTVMHPLGLPHQLPGDPRQPGGGEEH